MFTLSPWSINKFTISLDISVVKYSRYQLDIIHTNVNALTLLDESQGHNFIMQDTDLSGNIAFIIENINHLLIEDTYNLLTFTTDYIHNLVIQSDIKGILTITTDSVNNLVIEDKKHILTITHEDYNNILDIITEDVTNITAIYVEGAVIHGI